MGRIELVCPYCRNSLETVEKGVSCPKCHNTYTYFNDILSFWGQTDPFYEGRFTTVTATQSQSYLKNFIRTIYIAFSISSYEQRFFRKWLRKLRRSRNNLLILDFGCGGGNATLKNYGYTVGVDISVGSLKAAASIYDKVYHIDGTHLPFPNESFDLIFSSHVFGHVPLKEKDSIIAEMFRVLKHGGYMMHSIECDSESLIYRKAKQYPDLFERYFVEMYGHHGLELPISNFERFRKTGFIPIVEKTDIHRGYIRTIESYSVWFANDYAEKCMLFRILSAISKFLIRWQVLKVATNVALEFLIPIAFLFTPPNHRDSIKVLYQKP